MDAAQKLIFILALIFPLFTLSDWSAGLHHAGYFGDFAFGILYEPSTSHTFDFSIGFFPADGKRSSQINLAYHYSPWMIEKDNFNWRPVQAGIFAVTALENRHYFYRSPSQYPEDNYYDQTALRLGLDFGSQLDFQDLKISGAYYVRILDQSLIALYNNDYQNPAEYLSSGITLIYHFQ